MIKNLMRKLFGPDFWDRDTRIIALGFGIVALWGLAANLVFWILK